MHPHAAVDALVADPKLIRDALVSIERMRFMERTHLVLPEGLILLGLSAFVVEVGSGDP